MSYDLLKASTSRPLVFLMVDSADHLAAKTGLSPTVVISKNGGSFGSPAGAVSEIANGWYKVAGNATDTGTAGPLALHASATGADPVDILYTVIDPAESIYGANAVQVGGQTASAAGAVTFPGTIASTTNITAAAGCALAASQHVIVDSGSVTLANGAHGGASATITLQTPIAATVPDTQKVDLNTIKTQAVTCAAPVTVPAAIGTSTYAGADTTGTTTLLTRTPNAVPGATGGLLIAGSNAATTLASLAITSGNLPADVKAITAGVDLSDTMKASVNAEVDTALNTAIPGSPTADSINERVATLDTDATAIKAVTAKLDTAMEADAAVYRFTTNALEQAPTGGGAITVSDIMSEAVPGAYAAGSLGYAIGTYVDAKISLVGGSTGAGSTSWTLTIQDSVGAPLSDVDVWIKDATDSTVVAGTKQTDLSGNVTFMLDPGNYLRYAQKGGYNFTNPTAFTVT